MNNQSPPSGFNEAAWLEEQIARYGPIVGGAALRSLLGFRTTAAFQKARLQGQLGVAVFALAGRKGVFAVTQEACVWVLNQRQSSAIGAGETARPQGEEDASCRIPVLGLARSDELADYLAQRPDPPIRRRRPMKT